MNLRSATQEMKDEAYEYMAVRSVPGPFFIISFFLLFVYVSPIYDDQPKEILTIGILIVLNGIVRVVYEFGFKKLYPKNKKLWSFVYSISISSTALIWGMFCVLIVAEYDINWISLLVLICTAGLSTGGIIAVIPNMPLSIAFQALILLPTALYCFTLDSAAAYSISYMFICYLIFMSLMGMKLHEEYWTSVKNVRLLDERAKELEAARDEAIKLAETKTVFLTTMSHELRTPLNGVLGMSQLLSLSKLDKDQNDYVSTIKTSTELLLTIINDILDYSKLETGKLILEHQHFNLHVLLDDIHNLIKVTTQTRSLGFDINIASNCPYDLIGDQGKIRQILLNLLGNAIKFTKHGSITIDVECRKNQADQQILFRVTDTGIGIKADKQTEIFSDFTQADGSTTRKYGGTGLGLTISKQLVTLMNGKIGVESKENSGSTFWFQIPLLSVGVNNESQETKNTANFILDERVQTQLKETMEDQYTQLIEAHITSTNETLNNIQYCIETNNTDKLKIYMDSLKSSSASIGARALEAEVDFIIKYLHSDIQTLEEAKFEKLISTINEMVAELKKRMT